MGCGSCVSACPLSLIERSGDGIAVRRDACDACGKCADACPTGSLFRKGRDMPADEVVREVLRDGAFYANSGGGATVSGGEPFAQKDFLFELLAALRDAGVSTAVETTAYVEWDALERCLPLLDCVLVDVKHVDDGKHREWTGAGTGTILANIRKLREAHRDVRVRIPVIPGFNADADSRDRFGEVLPELATEVELLPYHVLGEGKYAMLGRIYPGAEISAANAAADAECLRETLRRRGVAASIGV